MVPNPSTILDLLNNNNVSPDDWIKQFKQAVKDHAKLNPSVTPWGYPLKQIATATSVTLMTTATTVHAVVKCGGGVVTHSGAIVAPIARRLILAIKAIILAYGKGVKRKPLIATLLTAAAYFIGKITYNTIIHDFARMPGSIKVFKTKLLSQLLALATSQTSIRTQALRKSLGEVLGDIHSERAGSKPKKPKTKRAFRENERTHPESNEARVKAEAAILAFFRRHHWAVREEGKCTTRNQEEPKSYQTVDAWTSTRRHHSVVDAGKPGKWSDVYQLFRDTFVTPPRVIFYHDVASYANGRHASQIAQDVIGGNIVVMYTTYPTSAAGVTYDGETSYRYMRYTCPDGITRDVLETRILGGALYDRECLMDFTADQGSFAGMYSTVHYRIDKHQIDDVKWVVMLTPVSYIRNIALRTLQGLGLDVTDFMGVTEMPIVQPISDLVFNGVPMQIATIFKLNGHVSMSIVREGFYRDYSLTQEQWCQLVLIREGCQARGERVSPWATTAILGRASPDASEEEIDYRKMGERIINAFANTKGTTRMAIQPQPALRYRGCVSSTPTYDPEGLKPMTKSFMSALLGDGALNNMMRDRNGEITLNSLEQRITKIVEKQRINSGGKLMSTRVSAHGKTWRRLMADSINRVGLTFMTVQDLADSMPNVRKSDNIINESMTPSDTNTTGSVFVKAEAGKGVPRIVITSRGPDRIYAQIVFRAIAGALKDMDAYCFLTPSLLQDKIQAFMSEAVMIVITDRTAADAHVHSGFREIIGSLIEDIAGDYLYSVSKDVDGVCATKRQIWVRTICTDVVDSLIFDGPIVSGNGCTSVTHGFIGMFISYSTRMVAARGKGSPEIHFQSCLEDLNAGDDSNLRVTESDLRWYTLRTFLSSLAMVNRESNLGLRVESLCDPTRGTDTTYSYFENIVPKSIPILPYMPFLARIFTDDGISILDTARWFSKLHVTTRLIKPKTISISDWPYVLALEKANAAIALSSEGMWPFVYAVYTIDWIKRHVPTAYAVNNKSVGDNWWAVQATETVNCGFNKGPPVDWMYDAQSHSFTVSTCSPFNETLFYETMRVDTDPINFPIMDTLGEVMKEVKQGLLIDSGAGTEPYGTADQVAKMEQERHDTCEHQLKTQLPHFVSKSGLVDTSSTDDTASLSTVKSAYTVSSTTSQSTNKSSSSGRKPNLQKEKKRRKKEQRKNKHVLGGSRGKMTRQQKMDAVKGGASFWVDGAAPAKFADSEVRKVKAHMSVHGVSGVFNGNAFNNKDLHGPTGTGTYMGSIHDFSGKEFVILKHDKKTLKEGLDSFKGPESAAQAKKTVDHPTVDRRLRASHGGMIEPPVHTGILLPPLVGQLPVSATAPTGGLASRC